MKKYIKRIAARFILLAFTVATVLQYMAYKQPAQAFTVGEEREVGEQLLTMVRKGFMLSRTRSSMPLQRLPA